MAAAGSASKKRGHSTPPKPTQYDVGDNATPVEPSPKVKVVALNADNVTELTVQLKTAFNEVWAKLNLSLIHI